MKHKKSITFRFVLTITVIFAIVFSVSLLIQVKTYQDAEKLSDALTDMHGLIREKKYGQAAEAYENLRKLWNSHKDHWYYYLNHTLIKEADLCVVRIGAYLESEQYGDAVAEEAALLRLLHEIKNRDIPLLHNMV